MWSAINLASKRMWSAFNLASIEEREKRMIKKIRVLVRILVVELMEILSISKLARNNQKLLFKLQCIRKNILLLNMAL